MEDQEFNQDVATNYQDVTSPDRTIDEAGNSANGIARGLGNWLDVTGRRVLDVGCGAGDLSGLAISKGARQIVGIDLSSKDLALARQRFDAEFIEIELGQYLAECESESFDIIFALNVLEHLTKSHLTEVLQQSRRVLSDGGVLIAMVPNATSSFSGMTRYWDITHHLAFTPSSCKQLQRLAGFSAVEFREWSPKPHGVVSSIRLILWQCIRLATMLRLLIETGSTKGRIYSMDMLVRFFK